MTRGDKFTRKLTDDLQFVLVPEEAGWTISIISPANPDEDFAKISTGPLHGPSPLDIDAVFFRNADNSGPPGGDNQARLNREFTFVLNHSEYAKVLNAINLAEYPNNASTKEKEDADTYLGIYPRGEGTFKIMAIKLSPTDKGKQPWIESLDFTADVCAPQILDSNKKTN